MRSLVDFGKDDAQADLFKMLMDLAKANDQLKETLEEYRLSFDKCLLPIRVFNIIEAQSSQFGVRYSGFRVRPNMERHVFADRGHRRSLPPGRVARRSN